MIYALLFTVGVVFGGVLASIICVSLLHQNDKYIDAIKKSNERLNEMYEREVAINNKLLEKR